MKKKLLLFMWVLCSVVFYSCQKNIKDLDMVASNDASLSKSFSGKDITACPTRLTDGTFAEVPLFLGLPEPNVPFVSVPIAFVPTVLEHIP